MKYLILIAIVAIFPLSVFNYQIDEFLEDNSPSLVEDAYEDNIREYYHDPIPFRRFRVRFRARFPRVRIPRVRLPRIRTPRIRIPRIRVPRLRLPRIRIDTPRLRRILPRIKIPRLSRRLTPRLRMRFGRVKIPGIRIFIRKKSPTRKPSQTHSPINPTTTAERKCFLGPQDGCENNWRVHDPYGFISYFNASCVKYNVCKECAYMKGWKMTSCQYQFMKDMKDTVCNNIADQFTKFVCTMQADKFYGFTKVINSNVVISPDWCKNKCVDEFAKPL